MEHQITNTVLHFVLCHGICIMYMPL